MLLGRPKAVPSTTLSGMPFSSGHPSATRAQGSSDQGPLTQRPKPEMVLGVKGTSKRSSRLRSTVKGLLFRVRVEDELRLTVLSRKTLHCRMLNEQVII